MGHVVSYIGSPRLAPFVLPAKILTIVSDLHSASITSVRTTSGETQPINVRAEVQQVCSLSQIIVNQVI